MRLLIDLDGVCANFYPRLLEMYNRDFKDNLTMDAVVSWKIDSSIFTKAKTEEIRQYFNVPGFWRGLSVITGAQEALRNIVSRGHEVLIVTACPDESERAYWEKKQWVMDNLPFIPGGNFISTWRKDLVRGDLLLDDGPHNLEAFPALTCAMDALYNRHVSSDFRVETWPQFEDLIELLNRTKF